MAGILYSCVCCFLRTYNLASHIKGSTKTEGFWNSVLRKKFEHKREEVKGSWRKLHNEEIHNLFSSPDIIIGVKSRRMRRAGKVACVGHKSSALRVLVGKPEGNRLVGKPKNSYKHNIKKERKDT